MRLVVVEFMTLDGVMEAPGYEEHRTGRIGIALFSDVARLGNGELIQPKQLLTYSVQKSSKSEKCRK